MCRYKALRAGQGSDSGLDSRLTIVKKPASAMSLRELRDSLANLQLEWPRFLERLADNPNAGPCLLSRVLERLADFG